jgi:hypothetical protein
VTIHFDDDIAWAKFRILELAERAVPRKDPDDVLVAARKFEQFVLPTATNLTLAGGKDAQKK